MEDQLNRVCVRIITKLRELRNQGLPHNPPPSSNWLGIESVLHLEEVGGRFILGAAGSPHDIRSWCTRAYEWVSRFSNRVVTHGDMHCGNVLVLGESVPTIIDYGEAGPGHPCFDLVRIATAVVCGHLQMLVDEGVLEKMFTDLIVNGISFDELEKQWSAMSGTATNRVVLRTFIECRSEAVKAAEEHGGDKDDYLAVQVIVAVQSLLKPQYQTGVSRAMVSAICEYLRVNPGCWSPKE